MGNLGSTTGLCSPWRLFQVSYRFIWFILYATVAITFFLSPAPAFTQNLSFPATGVWNGYLNQLNVVECTNGGDDSLTAELTVLSNSGTVLDSVNFNLPSKASRHIILNEFPIIDAYGTFKINTAQDSNLSCHTSFYRMGYGSTRSLEYAFSIPVTNPLYGETSGLYNSINPSAGSFPTYNWLSIYNPGDSTFKGELRIYDQTGAHKQSIFIGPLGAGRRMDYPLGHNEGQVVGLYKIVPEHDSMPYGAFLARYQQQSSGIFDFAFVLFPKAGFTTPVIVPASTMDPAINWAVVANPTAEAVDVDTEIRNFREDLIQEQLLSIPPYSQRHVFVNQHLGERRVGSFRAAARGEKPILVQSMFYGLPAHGGSQVVWAYGSEPLGTIPQGAKAINAVNTYLGAANWFKKFFPSGTPADLELALYRQNGSLLQVEKSTSTLDLGLHQTVGPDFIGLLTTEADSLFSAELLRVYPDTTNSGIGTIMKLPTTYFYPSSGSSSSSSSSVSSSASSSSSSSSSSQSSSSSSSSSNSSSSGSSSSTAGVAANFSATPTSGNENLAVNFVDQSSGNINSWVWNFGDGSSSTQQNPSHTYVSPGVYSVSLTVNGPGASPNTQTKVNYITIGASQQYAPVAFNSEHEVFKNTQNSARNMIRLNATDANFDALTYTITSLPTAPGAQLYEAYFVTPSDPFVYGYNQLGTTVEERESYGRGEVTSGHEVSIGGQLLTVNKVRNTVGDAPWAPNQWQNFILVLEGTRKVSGHPAAFVSKYQILGNSADEIYFQGNLPQSIVQHISAASTVQAHNGTDNTSVALIPSANWSYENRWTLVPHVAVLNDTNGLSQEYLILNWNNTSKELLVQVSGEQLPPQTGSQTLVIKYPFDRYPYFIEIPEQEHTLFREITAVPHIVSGNHVIYRPAPNALGVDQFQWRANDGNSNSNTATASITVTDWKPPIGIPTPAFGIYEVAPTPPSPWDGPVAGFFYVDNTHPDATDDNYTQTSRPTRLNNPGYPAKPRLTIPQPIPPGSVVEVRGGPYQYGQRAIITARGTVDKPVFVRGPDAENRPLFLNQIRVEDSSYVIVENLAVTNSSFNVSAPNESVVIRRCRSFEGSGMSSGSATLGVWNNNVVLFDNHIHDNGFWLSPIENDNHGIQIGRNQRNIWILDNHIYHSGGDSVQINSAQMSEHTSEFLFVGRNHMHHDRENAVDIKQSRDLVISENLAYGYFRSRNGDGSCHGDAMNSHYWPERIWWMLNTIYDAATGIGVGDTAGTYAIGNIVYDVKSQSQNYNPAILSFGGTGIWLRGNTALMAIGNTVFNVDSGISVAGGGIVELHNNIVSNVDPNNSALHIGTGGARIPQDHNWVDWVMENNIVGGNQAFYRWGGNTRYSLEQMQNQFGQCVNCQETDPIFENPQISDFRLQPGSPAISMGVDHSIFDYFEDLYDLNIRKDARGVNRPQQGGWDVGAYEYVEQSYWQPSGPSISYHPRSIKVLTGSSATFAVAATGTAPFQYQWRKNGVNINGATGPTLTITNVQSSDAANYSCVVSNGHGAALSGTASLTVQASTNLLQNHGFETGSSGWIGIDNENIRVLEHAVSYSGQRHLDMASVDQSTTAFEAHQEVSGIVSGDLYEVGGFITTQSIGSARVLVRWLNSSGGQIGEDTQVAFVSATTGTVGGVRIWALHYDSLVAPAGATKAQVVLQAEIGSSSIGWAKFDDIRFLHLLPAQ